MRILKISDGFVTNSSSQSGTIIIAVRKGKYLHDIFEKNNMTKNLDSYFEQDMEEIEDECKWNDLKIDYLRAEYNFYIGHFFFRAWGDEDIENEENQDAFDEIYYERNEKLKDLIILYCNDGQ